MGIASSLLSGAAKLIPASWFRWAYVAVALAVALVIVGLLWRLNAAKLEAANLRTELALAQDRNAVLEAAERQAKRSISGLQADAEASNKALEEFQRRMGEIRKIMSRASNRPAKQGEVVDDETSRRAVLHLNGLFGLRQ